jgi:hypothetical protein
VKTTWILGSSSLHGTSFERRLLPGGFGQRKQTFTADFQSATHARSGNFPFHRHRLPHRHDRQLRGCGQRSLTVFAIRTGRWPLGLLPVSAESAPRKSVLFDPKRGAIRTILDYLLPPTNPRRISFVHQTIQRGARQVVPLRAHPARALLSSPTQKRPCGRH